MGFDLAKLRTDDKKSNDGVWMNLDPEGTVQLLIARLRNEKFMEHMRQAMLKQTGKKASKKVAQLMGEADVDEELLIEGVAKYVLLGWKGILEDGKEVTYSEKEALRVLKDPQYKEFLEIVLELASDNEAFRMDATEQVAGN